MDQLPLDCLSGVIEALLDGDSVFHIAQFVDALVACSRVSRNFHGVSQPLIDTHVVLTSASLPAICERFGLRCSPVARRVSPIPLGSAARRIRVLAVSLGAEDTNLLDRLLETANGLKLVALSESPKSAWSALRRSNAGRRPDRLVVYHGLVCDLVAAESVKIGSWDKGGTGGGLAAAATAFAGLRRLRIDSVRRPRLTAPGTNVKDLCRFLQLAQGLQSVEFGAAFGYAAVRRLHLDRLPAITQFVIGTANVAFETGGGAYSLVEHLPESLIRLIVRGIEPGPGKLVQRLGRELVRRSTYLLALTDVLVDVAATAPDIFRDRGINLVMT